MGRVAGVARATPAPLRTVRASFPAHSSSLRQRPSQNAADYATILYYELVYDGSRGAIVTIVCSSPPPYTRQRIWWTCHFWSSSSNCPHLEHFPCCWSRSAVKQRGRKSLRAKSLFPFVFLQNDMRPLCFLYFSSLPKAILQYAWLYLLPPRRTPTPTLGSLHVGGHPNLMKPSSTWPVSCGVWFGECLSP